MRSYVAEEVNGGWESYNGHGVEIAQRRDGIWYARVDGRVLGFVGSKADAQWIAAQAVNVRRVH